MDDWMICHDCEAVFPAEDAECGNIHPLHDDVECFCPYCGSDFLLMVDAPDTRREAVQVAVLFLVVVLICVFVVVVGE